MKNVDASGLDGLVVAERKWLPGRVRQLVLFEPHAKWTRDFSNLILREREGLIVWRAEIPEGDVAFLAFEVMDAQNEVLTVTMRKRAVVLDVATGLVKAVSPVLADSGGDDQSQTSSVGDATHPAVREEVQQVYRNGQVAKRVPQTRQWTRAEASSGTFTGSFG